MKAFQVVVFVVLLAISTGGEAQTRFVTIGSGGVTGVYYPTGNAICRLLNRTRREHGIRCTVESTGGSAFNLATIQAGETDFGIAQSAQVFQAYHGTGMFQRKDRFRDLRTVFAASPEPLTIVAAARAGIGAFEDLKGKRVNVGRTSSSQYQAMQDLMQVLGWNRRAFQAVGEFDASEQSIALCAGKVDAIVFAVSHPSTAVKEATSGCDTRLLPIPRRVVDALVGKHPYYRPATIPGGMYAGAGDDIPTFGSSATVVTSSNTPGNVVYWIVKSVFENFDQFKRLHPAFAHLKKEEMVMNSRFIPMHEGAEKFYREYGLFY